MEGDAHWINLHMGTGLTAELEQAAQGTRGLEWCLGLGQDGQNTAGPRAQLVSVMLRGFMMVIVNTL